MITDNKFLTSFLHIIWDTRLETQSSTQAKFSLVGWKDSWDKTINKCANIYPSSNGYLLLKICYHVLGLKTNRGRNISNLVIFNYLFNWLERLFSKWNVICKNTIYAFRIIIWIFHSIIDMSFQSIANTNKYCFCQAALSSHNERYNFPEYYGLVGTFSM